MASEPQIAGRVPRRDATLPASNVVTTDGSDAYECMPTPSCPSQFPTCGCLADETCGDSCSGDYATGLTPTCFAI